MASAMAYSSDRASQMLGSVNCSGCRLPISLADLETHVCAPLPPMPTIPAAASRSRSNSNSSSSSNRYIPPSVSASSQQKSSTSPMKNYQPSNLSSSQTTGGRNNALGSRWDAVPPPSRQNTSSSYSASSPFPHAPHPAMSSAAARAKPPPSNLSFDQPSRVPFARQNSTTSNIPPQAPSISSSRVPFANADPSTAAVDPLGKFQPASPLLGPPSLPFANSYSSNGRPSSPTSSISSMSSQLQSPHLPMTPNSASSGYDSEAGGEAGKAGVGRRAFRGVVFGIMAANSMATSQQQQGYGHTTGGGQGSISSIASSSLAPYGGSMSSRSGTPSSLSTPATSIFTQSPVMSGRSPLSSSLPNEILEPPSMKRSTSVDSLLPYNSPEPEEAIPTQPPPTTTRPTISIKTSMRSTTSRESKKSPEEDDIISPVSSASSSSNKQPFLSKYAQLKKSASNASATSISSLRPPRAELATIPGSPGLSTIITNDEDSGEEEEEEAGWKSGSLLRSVQQEQQKQQTLGSHAHHHLEDEDDENDVKILSPVSFEHHSGLPTAKPTNKETALITPSSSLDRLTRDELTARAYAAASRARNGSLGGSSNDHSSSSISQRLQQSAPPSRSASKSSASSSSQSHANSLRSGTSSLSSRKNGKLHIDTAAIGALLEEIEDGDADIDLDGPPVRPGTAGRSNTAPTRLPAVLSPLESPNSHAMRRSFSDDHHDAHSHHQPPAPSHSSTRKQCLKCGDEVGFEVGKKFVEMNDGAGVLCEKDWMNLYLPRCRRCALPISTSAISSVDGQLKGKYHKECFSCYSCDQPFTSSTFFVFGQRPYCEGCYHRVNGSNCGGCGQGIEGNCLIITGGQKEEKFHPHCLGCDHPGIKCTQKMDQYFSLKDKRYCDLHIREAQARSSKLGGPSVRAERRRTRLLVEPVRTSNFEQGGRLRGF